MMSGYGMSIPDPEVMFSVAVEATQQSMTGLPQDVKARLKSLLKALKSGA